MTKITPLLTFLRAFLDRQDRVEFAKRCGTSEVYLYQLAAQPYPNPRLRLAKALVRESKLLSRRLMTPALTLDQLLEGTGDESDAPTRFD